MATATTPDPETFGGWTPKAMRGLGASARQINHWRDVGLLRPEDPHPGSGFATPWSPDDRRDARAALAFYRLAVGAGRSKGYGGWIPLATLVLDRWRDLGRPEGVYLGVVNGHPALWTSDADLLHDLDSGAAVVVIPAPPRQEVTL